MKTAIGIILLFVIPVLPVSAQVDNWMKIIKETQVEVKYFSPVKSESFTMLHDNGTKENESGLMKEFGDKSVNVKLIFKKYESHFELFGEASKLTKDDLCFTIKVIFPLRDPGVVAWSYDLDSTVSVGPATEVYSNYVDANCVNSPDGAFNADQIHNGGYGDNLGSGQMSFYPLGAVSAHETGFGWGVNMGIPVVFRLSYEPRSGIISEFDVAISSETKQFPNRTFFSLLLFEYDAHWNMRGALKKYYEIQPEYFKRRATHEGIWLPFSPLLKIKGWKDFGFAFHETDWKSRDNGLKPPVSTIEAGKIADVLTFQYTDPWEQEIPISKPDLTYDQVTGKEIISGERSDVIRTDGALDKEGKLIARKLKTPWFPTGWAVSINIDTDPDLKGFNAYDGVCKNEIYPALGMNVDGIYFDCLEWLWQYDTDYNPSHFEYTDYPLTFSSSLDKPRPVVWSYSSDYKMLKKVSDQMHEQGKYVMGNGYGWIPFEAGALDLFGSELNWHSKTETGSARLKFYRALSHQKPVVFLLNEGMDDSVFTQPPYEGYAEYFEKMLFYGFFPSFFSVNSSNDVYWADSVKCDQGRPYFIKYIPLIKEISMAGWQPITLATLSNKELRIERFGTGESDTIYFTLLNPGVTDAQTSVTISAKDLSINKVSQIEEMIEGKELKYEKSTDTIKVALPVKKQSTRLIKIVKQ